MPDTFKKILAATVSALAGLILIPVLSFGFSIDQLLMLVIFFLPGLTLGLIILFELIIWIGEEQNVYNFIKRSRMIALFFALLALQWIVMLIVDPDSDMIFILRLATAIIPSVRLYYYLGQKMDFL